MTVICQGNSRSQFYTQIVKVAKWLRMSISPVFGLVQKTMSSTSLIVAMVVFPYGTAQGNRPRVLMFKIDFFVPEGPTLNDLADLALHIRRLIASVRVPLH